jgi:hypothetical protein
MVAGDHSRDPCLVEGILKKDSHRSAAVPRASDGEKRNLQPWREISMAFYFGMNRLSPVECDCKIV